MGFGDTLFSCETLVLTSVFANATTLRYGWPEYLRFHDAAHHGGVCQFLASVFEIEDVSKLFDEPPRRGDGKWRRRMVLEQVRCHA